MGFFSPFQKYETFFKIRWAQHWATLREKCYLQLQQWGSLPLSCEHWIFINASTPLLQAVGANSSSLPASQVGQPSSCLTKTLTASCLRGCFQENGTNQVLSSKSCSKCKGLFLVFLMWLCPGACPACRAPLARWVAVVGLDLSNNWGKS